MNRQSYTRLNSIRRIPVAKGKCTMLKKQQHCALFSTEDSTWKTGKIKVSQIFENRHSLQVTPGTEGKKLQHLHKLKSYVQSPLHIYSQIVRIEIQGFLFFWRNQNLNNIHFMFKRAIFGSVRSIYLPLDFNMTLKLLIQTILLKTLIIL